MSKFQDFYVKATADAEAKKELVAILDGKAINKATDAQLEKISAIAKRLGFDITVSEAKEYLTANGKELSEGDLDAVAGGEGTGKGIFTKGDKVIYRPTQN